MLYYVILCYIMLCNILLYLLFIKLPLFLSNLVFKLLIMDDELFMADSSPSKPEEALGKEQNYPPISQMFYSNNKKCKIVAYHMLKSILKRISYKYSCNFSSKKLKSFLR